MPPKTIPFGQENKFDPSWVPPKTIPFNVNDNGVSQNSQDKYSWGLPPSPPPQPGILNRIGSSISNAFKGGISQATEGYNQAKNASNPLQLLEGGTKLAAGAINTAFSPLAPVMTPVGQATDSISNKISDIPAVQNFAQTPLGQGVARGAEDVGNLATVAQGVAGVMETPKVISKGADIVKSDIADTRGMYAEKNAQKTLQKNISAVDPELAGKAKINAYKEITKGRGAEPGGMFKEQNLSPAERTVNLAKRLSNDTPLTNGEKVSGVKFGKNPVINLQTIGKSLTETEKAITKNMVEGDPRFNLGKDELVRRLETAKNNAPREFSRIRDSKSMYNDVIDFAKEQVMNAEDTIKGGRDARTAFDTQARKEYPSVYKDGYIDTKTPAGSAIKAARDIINEHMYNAAPQGGDLQTLIGREADLLNARDVSAIKASKTHGANWFEKMSAKYPNTAKTIKWGAIPATLGIGYEAKQALTGQ